MRFPRVAILAGLCLPALLALPGCGGSSSQPAPASHPAPPAAEFPKPAGRPLKQLLRKEASGPSQLVLSPASQVFYAGKNRYSFGVFTLSHGTVPNAQVALYIAKAPPKNAKPGTPQLGGTASGPFPARIESLKTPPKYQALTTKKDPDAATTVYVTDLTFPTDGEWQVGALIKQGGKLTGTVLPSAIVGKVTDIPRVGQRPPDIHTPTVADVHGDLAKITTRVPPDHLNAVDFHDVLGKKPIALLFATPQFCQSRVCGPVVDIAEQVQHEFGRKVDFIHMEIYKDNDPGKGTNSQVRAFNLPSEPWLFVIDRHGVIRTEIEGAFDAAELTKAVKGVTGG